MLKSHACAENLLKLSALEIEKSHGMHTEPCPNVESKKYLVSIIRRKIWVVGSYRI